MYGGGAEAESESEEEAAAGGQETTEVKEGAEKITVIKKRIPKKRKVEAEEEGGVLDTGLSLQDDEDLALQLLMS